MPVPPDHADLLRRADYPVPPTPDLSDADRQLVARFGYWMEGLLLGAIVPATPDQERFVQAARGLEPPQSAFELAWTRVRPPAPPTSHGALSAVAAQLVETRAAALAVQQTFVFRQLDIMAKVQPELDALAAEMATALKPLEAEMARLETALKEGTRAAGRSFWHRGVKVTYSRGRITFDSKAMQQYALRNPEVNQFRKIGQPVVTLRYVSPDEPPPADPTDDPHGEPM